MILKSDLHVTIETVIKEELEETLTPKERASLVSSLVDRIQQEHEVLDDVSEADGDADEHDED